MKTLLTGAGGQVGWEIVRRAKAHPISLKGFPRNDLDITDRDAIHRVMETVRPDLVINAAAYTKVDLAESEPDTAIQVNRTGPGFLAEWCAGAGIPMIHISTDYVFDGCGTTPYLETDPLSPLGVYGRSKAEGEADVRRKLSRHLIVRTAWVYGVHGSNFVKTMLRLGREREHLRVVDDQVGCPTSASDIADAILALVQRINAGGEVPWGTYHYCGNGITSWYRFAVEIFRLARQFGYAFSPEIEPIPSTEYPTPVTRPGFSALDTARITDTFQIKPRPWRESLAEVVEEMLAEEVGGRRSEV